MQSDRLQSPAAFYEKYSAHKVAKTRCKQEFALLNKCITTAKDKCEVYKATTVHCL